MKKTALFLLTLLTLWSCGDDVQFNTPGFSGNKNYNLWRATYYNGSIADGKLKIVAGNNSEEMSLSLSASTIGTYLLSETSFSKAEFIDFQEIEYSTTNPPDPSVSLYPEIGEVIITESSPEYVTGTFRFIAYSNDGLKSVGFNDGDFYRIPVNTVAEEALTCNQALINLTTASANYDEVAPGDAQYAARCNAYKTALQQAKTACGDTDGAYQAIIDGLGDCN